MQKIIKNNSIVIYDSMKQKWLLFTNPKKIYQSNNSLEIPSVLKKIEKHSTEKKLYAVGFISYESSYKFLAIQNKKPASNFPLLWFGIYNQPKELNISIFQKKTNHISIPFQNSISHDDYRLAFKKVKHYISRGQSYQLNYSYRLIANLQSLSYSPWDLFIQMINAQASPLYKKTYGAYLQLDDWIICCASPELFFRLDGKSLYSRPMKGTSARGLWYENDIQKKKILFNSPKERAENSIIIDMMRNDFGSIAKTGTINLNQMYFIERYPSLWQMTSEVRCLSNASLFEILCATFPPASVTGAPKKRTVEILNELENSPREIYTGSIGFLAPGRKAQFNVAIRTALIERKTQKIRYGIGSGLIWDSDEQMELKECKLKSAVLGKKYKVFDIVETILWTPNKGYLLLEEHLSRLNNSAIYFDYPVDLKKINKELNSLTKKIPAKESIVRLLLSSSGKIKIEFKAKDTSYENNYSICLAKMPIDSTNPFLYHKTSHRDMYKQAKEMCPKYDDVLLWNGWGLYYFNGHFCY